MHAQHGGDPRPPEHIPVLVDEVRAILAPAPGDVLLDCTVGRGGHAAALVDALGPDGRYIALDCDADNLPFVRQRLAGARAHVDVIHAPFADAPQALADLGVERVTCLLADLGFCSTQMDDPERGFSFQAEGPLDMRLNAEQQTTAADLVGSLKQTELADLIYQYGEERRSRRIAQKIVEARQKAPILTTGQLASICAAAYGPKGRGGRIDPATRTFQALRIAVNDELGQLEALLGHLPDLVGAGGRAAIISFHSLEDRMVKRAFRQLEDEGRAKRLTRKPIVAGDAEVATNRRARSAKLRGLLMTGGFQGR